LEDECASLLLAAAGPEVELVSMSMVEPLPASAAVDVLSSTIVAAASGAASSASSGDPIWSDGWGTTCADEPGSSGVAAVGVDTTSAAESSTSA
jgi:hypothetical protein